MQRTATPPAASAHVAAPAPADRAADARPAGPGPAAVHQTAPQQPRDAQRPPEQPSVGTSLPSDEFAGLPRLRPFTDFELDPIDPPAPAYSGRRRADEPVGRHGAHDDEPGGRRRAGDGHDVLAQILQREAAR